MRSKSIFEIFLNLKREKLKSPLILVASNIILKTNEKIQIFKKLDL